MRKDLKRFNHHYSPSYSTPCPHSTIFSMKLMRLCSHASEGKFLGHLKELFEHFWCREAFTLPSDNAFTV